MTEALRCVAPLVWGSLRGTTVDDEARALLATGIGGVVLFSRNIVDPDQLARLCREVRAAAAGPVRISIDQEGGHIVRLGAPLTRFPSAMSIGATGDPELAYEVARASARELSELGVDVVLAPVLDVAADLRSAVVGARAFSSDPLAVAELGAASIRGYLDGGLLPVPKHFPGHGRTAADSHLDVPCVDGSLADLAATDLPPYRAAIAAGTPALMTAHVVHRSIDARVPATLARRALVDLARGELGFDGLIVTDALVMDAIARTRPLARAAVEAIGAGADVVMALDASWRALDALEAALLHGQLDARDVARARARVAAFDAAAVATRAVELAPISHAVHGRLARRSAKRSLTLVSDAGLLPLGADEPVILVDVASVRPSPIEDERGESHSLAVALGLRFPRLRAFRVDPRTGIGIVEALEAVASAPVAIVATRDAFASADSRLVVGALCARPTVRIALRNPADLLLEPTPAAAIAAYADTPPTADALAAALSTGRRAFPGRLPVTLHATPEVSAA